MKELKERQEFDKAETLKRAGIAIAILCAVAIFGMYFSIMKMQQEISSLSQQINDLQSSISSTVGSTVSGAVSGISASIDESLKKSNSIIADYSYKAEPDKFNREDKTIPVNLKVTPKEYRDGLTAAFLIDTQNGKTVTVPAVAGENGTYTATVPIPIVDYFKLSAVFDDGTLKKSEKLEDVYSPFSGYVLNVNSNLEEYSAVKKSGSSGKYKFEWSGRTSTNITGSSPGTESDHRSYPVSGELKILKNGKIIDKKPIQFEKNDDIDSSQIMDAYYSTDFKTTISCKANDLIKVMITVEDNHGLKYTQTVDQERVDGSGNMNPVGSPGESIIE